MDLYAIIEQVQALLREQGRLSYRALKYQFHLDDEGLEALKEELIDAKRLAMDENGKVLVSVGDRSVVSSQSSVVSPQPSAPHTPPPIAYTPPHLAERIRAAAFTDGERKTITALFADLKGSTALIEGLDPEEARAILDPALQVMMDAVHRYEGYVAQALGDGIFALFGAPLAHEDHPQRALYAALRMQEEMRQYGNTLRTKGYAPLALRVGVNTGEVVVRSIRKDDLHTDYVPVGHSTNLAARMEQLAAPGSVLVSAYTHKLTEGYFAFKELGQLQIKGVEDALAVYEVLGAGPLRTRLQVTARRRGLTRFVGRRSELGQLQQALEQAQAGHGQIVGVMGEPGLGKSRLFYEFKLLSQAGCLVLEAYSVSHGKASPYLPIIELLKSYFRIEPQDHERTRREKIAGKVVILDRTLEEILPYLYALLGVEEQPSPLQQMDPQIRRKRTFEALKKLFLRESLNQPLILLFEDLHWIDGETQGFLDTLSESVASAKILLLTNYRPEYRHEWGHKTYYTQLRLVPFGKAEAEEFLDELLSTTREGQRVAPLQTLKQLILDKTEGTPFFIEEVVQELFEQGVLVRTAVGADLRVGPLSGAHASTPPTCACGTGAGRTGSGGPLQIPTTVQGVLAARIDRLAPEEKVLLQQLAVIGREFPLSLIRQVVTQPEEELYRLLSSLQQKEFLYEQPAFPEVEYVFKHALTQEVAYGTVLQERRKTLHERTAQAIEVLFHARLEDHYEALAHHYTRSGNTAKAVEYLYLAGQQAVQRTANGEAIRHFTTAVTLLQTLPDTPERTQLELRVQSVLGPTLMVTQGYGATEAEQAYRRALELCGQTGETLQRFPLLWGLCIFSFFGGEFSTGHELAAQLLQLAQRACDPNLLVEAHLVQASLLEIRGEQRAAREHCEQALACYRPEQHALLASRTGRDPGVVCLNLLPMILWLLGYPDQALQRSQEALTLAQKISHSVSIILALGYAAVVHWYRRESQAAREIAEAAIALATEQGFPWGAALAMPYLGWALVEQGREQEGIALIEQGLATFRAAGQELMQPRHLALLAEAYGTGGQVEEGLSALAEALAMVDKNGEREWEAELHRLKGELTLAQSRVQSLESGVQKEAEEYFHKAIEIAQRQQAKSLELRAVMSLARLWQQQGKRAEAHQLLSEIYGWFTEGFDTKDLQEARALLEQLA